MNIPEVIEWIRNHYQDYPNIDSLCAGLLAAAPPAPAAQASEPHTPNASLPPLGEGPRVKIHVTVEVPSDWEQRLDMQWVLEREIHADRWSWNWPQAQQGLQAPLSEAGWTDADADAARLALELECLLSDKDVPMPALSRWWDSAHEALKLHRERMAGITAPRGQEGEHD